jgi:hypothetical protein
MPDAGVAQRRIALGLAAAALVVASIAVVVVIRRGGETHEAALVEREIGATDLLRLREWHSVDAVGQGDRAGVKIKDAELAKQLGLQPDDVIVAVSGHRVTRDFDVYAALAAEAQNDATTVYAELARGALMRWRVQGDLHPATGQLPMPAPTPGRLDDPDPPDPVIDSIRKLDDTHYSVPRTSVDAVLDNPMQMAKQMRIVPSIKLGKPNGFKLYAIRPSSLPSRIGFQNGDTVIAVNGGELTTPDKALELYTKLKSMDHFTFDIERRGKALQLEIIVR